MKITIIYTLYTDGDYRLEDYEKFGAKKTGDHTYEGSFVAEGEDTQYDTRDFLERFLCDGIRVYHTHYYILESFYNVIDSLIDEVFNDDGDDIIRKKIGGNYTGTEFIMIKE